jgi:hypothetical protein
VCFLRQAQPGLLQRRIQNKLTQFPRIFYRYVLAKSQPIVLGQAQVTYRYDDKGGVRISPGEEYFQPAAPIEAR